MKSNAIFFKVLAAFTLSFLSITVAFSAGINNKTPLPTKLGSATAIKIEKTGRDIRNIKPSVTKKVQGKKEIPQTPQSTVPLIFEKNVGQVDENIDYLLRQQNYVMYFTENAFISEIKNPKTSPSSSKGGENKPSLLKMSLMNAQAVKPEGVRRVKTIVNQYIGTDEKKWLTNIPGYSQLYYKSVYKGVDMLWKSKDGFPEYQFNVDGDASEESIRIKFNSSSPLTLDKDTLKITFPNGVVFHSEPSFFEETPKGKKPLKGHYVLLNKHEIGFKVFNRGPGRNLVIDPKVSFTTRSVRVNNPAAYEQFLPRIKDGLDIESFGSGHSVFISGTAMGLYLRKEDYGRSGADSFILKMKTPGKPFLLSPTGSSGERGDGTTFLPVSYITYLGGSKSELNTVISIGNNGEIYFGGTTLSDDFPTPGRTFRDSQETPFTRKTFVGKLSGAGKLLLGTMIGANSAHTLNDIQFSEGGIYVAGVAEKIESGSSDATDSAYQQKVLGRTDGFVSKLDAELTRLAYFTYLGSEDNGTTFRGADSIYGLDVHDGQVYLAGTTASPTFPTTPRRPQDTTPRAAQGTFTYPENSNNSCDDTFTQWCYEGFVTVLDEAGSEILYSTFYGGPKVEIVNDISVDDRDAVVITGTIRGNFDFTDVTPQQIFVAKLTPFSGGVEFDYNKIFETLSEEGGVGRGNAIHIDNFGSVHVSGETSGNLNDVVSRSDGFGHSSVLGDSDMFYMFIPPNSTTGDPSYFTYFGSEGTDRGQGITTIPDPTSGLICSVVVGHLNVDYPPSVFPFVPPQDLGVYSFCIDEDDRNPPGDPCVNCSFTIHAERARTEAVEAINVVAPGTPFIYAIRVFNGFQEAGVATIIDQLPEFVETMGEPSVLGAEGTCRSETSTNNNDNTIATIECENIIFPPNARAEIRIPVMLSRSLLTNVSCPPSLSNTATIFLGIESIDTEVLRTNVINCPSPLVPEGERCYEQNCEEGFVCATLNQGDCNRPGGCGDDGDEPVRSIPTCQDEDREDITLID